MVNWELIVINDGSNDRTEEIVKEYCTLDKRIELVSIKNSGVATARNIRIENANGE